MELLKFLFKNQYGTRQAGCHDHKAGGKPQIEVNGSEKLFHVRMKIKNPGNAPGFCVCEYGLSQFSQVNRNHT
jgi:hypothetical protein